MTYLPAFYLPPRYLPSGEPDSASYWPDDARRHEVYTRPTRDGADTLVATVWPGDDPEVVITGAPSTERFVWVRAFNRLDKPDAEDVAPKLRRVAFDAAGELILPVPNAPINLTLAPAAGGKILATWSYNSFGQETPPASYHVYVATGVAAFNFTTPDQVVSSSGRVLGRTITTAAVPTGAFAHGTVVRVVVRAVGEPGVGAEENNTTEATATADAVAPDAPASLTVEVTDQ